MSDASVAPAAKALVEACTWIHETGGAPATSGNFSVRLPDGRLLLTASGKHKGCLVPDDLLVVDLEGTVLDTAGVATTGKPSAETLLHLQLYRRDPAIGAVLHVHTVHAMVLSRTAPDPFLLQGWELQKALEGETTHEAAVALPVFDNTQDMTALAAQVDARMDADGVGHGYLIRGHGLYTWGRDLEAARRHVEALDALFQCVLLERRL